MTDFLLLLQHFDWVFEQCFISATSTARVWLLFFTTFSYYYYFDFSTTLYFLVSDSFLEQLFYGTTTGRQTDFLTTLYFLVLDSFLEQLFYNTTTGRQTDFLTTLQLHYKHY